MADYKETVFNKFLIIMAKPDSPRRGLGKKRDLGNVLGHGSGEGVV